VGAASRELPGRATVRLCREAGPLWTEPAKFSGRHFACPRLPAGEAFRCDAAHVRWFTFDGPDALDNGLAVCALHHKLFDLGVLGLDLELQVQVSAPLKTALRRSPGTRTLTPNPRNSASRWAPGWPRSARECERSGSTTAAGATTTCDHARSPGRVVWLGGCGFIKNTARSNSICPQQKRRSFLSGLSSGHPRTQNPDCGRGRAPRSLNDGYAGPDERGLALRSAGLNDQGW